MYVRIQRRPADDALGQWWNPFSRDNAVAQAAYYYIHGNVMPPTLPSGGGKTAPPPVPTDNSFIPGSSFSDYLLNAVTGKPTDAQINYNANQCVQNIQRMRQMQGGAAIPPGAESACATDQEAYKKLIGGTAQDVLANVIKPISIGSSALLWLGLIGVGIFVATR